MDFSKVIAGMRIEYIGDSLAYGGSYKLVRAEDTYTDRSKCPEYEKGKLMIIEFTNDDRAMFFTLDKLNPNDWKVEDATLELYNYFWNCQEVDYDDSGENRFRGIVNNEFDDKMCDLFGDSIYDLESVVLNFNIGEWVIPDFSDLYKHGYTESMLKQIDSDLEGHSLIELNQEFIDFMKGKK